MWTYMYTLYLIFTIFTNESLLFHNVNNLEFITTP